MQQLKCVLQTFLPPSLLSPSQQIIPYWSPQTHFSSNHSYQPKPRVGNANLSWTEQKLPAFKTGSLETCLDLLKFLYNFYVIILVHAQCAAVVLFVEKEHNLTRHFHTPDFWPCWFQNQQHFRGGGTLTRAERAEDRKGGRVEMIVDLPCRVVCPA